MIALLILAGLGIFSLLGVILNLRKSVVPVLLTGLIIALGFTLFQAEATAFRFHNMLYFDQYSRSFIGLLCFIAIFWFFCFERDLKIDEHRIEKFSLILFSLVGGVFMITFNHMVILFLGIEILSIPLYTLAASQKKDSFSIEAGLKYFLMSSFASAFLLLGMALIYGAAGSFELTQISEVFRAGSSGFPGWFHLGLSLMILGLCFKVSAAPFHFWTPDVYEGSPTMFTAYMSTVVKIAAFAGFSRVLTISSQVDPGQHQLVILICCVLSLIIGNLMAVYPDSAKRMLAYSGIAQAGYLLIPLLSIQGDSIRILFYGLTAYVIASISLFMVINAFEKNYGRIQIQSFNGLAQSHPLLAVGISLSLISLAGVPPLAGFMGKYLIFSLAISAGYISLVILAVVTSLIGVYYYFKIIIAMYFRQATLQTPTINLQTRICVGILSLLLILLGIFPDTLFG